MPPVTKNLIIINVLFFLGAAVATKYGFELSDYLGLHYFMSENFNPAQLISYMFMHGTGGIILKKYVRKNTT